jgi:hypothetical protein
MKKTLDGILRLSSDRNKWEFIPISDKAEPDDQHQAVFDYLANNLVYRDYLLEKIDELNEKRPDLANLAAKLAGDLIATVVAELEEGEPFEGEDVEFGSICSTKGKTAELSLRLSKYDEDTN